MDKQRSDNIDNRFRQAAENFIPPPPTEEAWMKMEALLDKAPRKKRPLIWWWFSGLLGLLLLGGAGGYYVVQSRHESSVAVPISSVPPQGSTAAPASTPGTSAAPDGKQGEPAVTDPGKPEKVPSSPAESNVSASGHQPVSPESAGTGTAGGASGITRSGTPSGRVRRDEGAVTASGREKHPELTGSLRGRNNHRTGRQQEKEEASSTSPEKEEAVLTPFSTIPDVSAGSAGFTVRAPGMSANSAPQARIADSLLKQAEALIRLQKQKVPPPPRLYVVLSGSRNATSLRNFDTKNIANVWGIEAGYHLLPWLSIQTGFHAGRKLYSASREDYKLKSRYWDTMKNIRIVANCQIFDLPLSLRFDLLRNRKNGLYAIAGMSSFLMNTENYTYHYYTPMGNYNGGKVRYTDHMDWFSSVNFSVGYEQQVFRKFYLQAEPYAKLPLSGIGQGSVKLYSLGLQVGVKYEPFKK